MNNNYANIRGSVERPKEIDVAQNSVDRKLAPLSAEQQRKLEVRLEQVNENAPELFSFIRELYKLGMVDGYRCVTKFKNKKTGEVF